MDLLMLWTDLRFLSASQQLPPCFLQTGRFPLLSLWNNPNSHRCKTSGCPCTVSAMCQDLLKTLTFRWGQPQTQMSYCEMSHTPFSILPESPARRGGEAALWILPAASSRQRIFSSCLHIPSCCPNWTISKPKLYSNEFYVPQSGWNNLTRGAQRPASSRNGTKHSGRVLRSVGAAERPGPPCRLSGAFF